MFQLTHLTSISFSLYFSFCHIETGKIKTSFSKLIWWLAYICGCNFTDHLLFQNIGRLWKDEGHMADEFKKVAEF